VVVIAELLEPIPTVVRDRVDERAARRSLRAQVKRLERELADTLIAAFPRAGVDVAVPAHGGPRLLGLAELELLRDDLAEKLRRAQEVVRERGEDEVRNRDLLERMLRDPKRYKFARLPNRDLGESGCGVWEVRPRLGIIGMLAGWWHVKLSSGCPLAGAQGIASAPMGKRSRKRASPDAPRTRPVPVPEAAPTRGRPVTRKARLDEAPPALWSPFPLTELLIFVGLILTIVGFFTGAIAALVIGIMLVSVAALELSIREHFAGYRSHSSLLAAVSAVAVNVPLYWTPIPQEALLLTAGIAFAGAFQVLRSAFAKRAGGLKFRA